MATEVELAKSFVYDLIEEYLEGLDIITKVSMAKMYVCDLVNRLAYHGVQIHGGYGCMIEYEIGRHFCDVRHFSISGGTSEIMKVIIGRRMGLT
jgi:acyl-CoA dehydrogenase